MNKVPVYSIVAFSGTGKTTLLEKLIPKLKSRGLRVAVIKHEAHEFEIDKAGKDSWRMTRAGSDMTIIASDTKAAIMENRAVSVEELIAMVHDVDIVLTEGYKHGSWPKILVYREAAGKTPALKPEESFAVLSDVLLTDKVPCLALDDAEGLADLIVRDMRNQPESSVPEDCQK